MSYRECNSCGKEWVTREAFLSDPEVELIGYQSTFRALAAGLFLFNHLAEDCQTTLAVPAGEFFDLYEGPLFEGRLAGSKECPAYCLNHSELSRCPARCECAFVREVLQIVQKWPKATMAPKAKAE